MNTEDALVKETKKWKEKILPELEKSKPKGSLGKEFLENAKAYVKDSDYFSGKKDFIRAFEAVVWAWAVLETGRKAGLLD